MTAHTLKAEPGHFAAGKVCLGSDAQRQMVARNLIHLFNVALRHTCKCRYEVNASERDEAIRLVGAGGEPLIVDAYPVIVRATERDRERVCLSLRRDDLAGAINAMNRAIERLGCRAGFTLPKPIPLDLTRSHR
jgi:hypothetical protein